MAACCTGLLVPKGEAAVVAVVDAPKVNAGFSGTVDEKEKTGVDEAVGSEVNVFAPMLLLSWLLLWPFAAGIVDGLLLLLNPFALPKLPKPLFDDEPNAPVELALKLKRFPAAALLASPLPNG